METDTRLLELFQAHPEWLGLLAFGKEGPSGKVVSITTKRSERRIDAVHLPDNESQPIYVVEFQFFKHDRIYARVAEEMLALERLYPSRQVIGIVFLAHKSLDPKGCQWRKMVVVRYFDAKWRQLSRKHPDHPLAKVLSPAFEKNGTKLEKSAARVYKELRERKDPDGEVLLSIFEGFILSRFKHLSLQDLQAMLELIPVEQTRAGRELIKIGEARGVASGKHLMLLKILENRFGKLTLETGKLLKKLNANQLEVLARELFDLKTKGELLAWFKKRQ